MIGWMYHTAHLLPPHEEWRGGTACLLSRMITTSDDSQPQMAHRTTLCAFKQR